MCLPLSKSSCEKELALVSKERRMGVVGIVVEQRDQVPKINSILSSHGDVIVGRLGVPYRERDIAVIALIVDGTTDEIGALTGKLGQLSGVQVKSTLVTR